MSNLYGLLGKVRKEDRERRERAMIAEHSDEENQSPASSSSCDLSQLSENVPDEVSVSVLDDWKVDTLPTVVTASPESSLCVSLGLSPLSASAESVHRLRVRPDVARLYRTPGAIRCSRKQNSRTLPHINYFSKYSFPKELLVEIFSFLNKTDLISVSLTCKRFLEASYDPRLWEYMDLGDRFLKESSLHSLADRGLRVLRLTKSTVLRNLSPRTDSVFLFPDAPLSKLTHIDLSMAVFAEPSIIAGLLQRCIFLQGVAFESNVLDDRICMALGRNTDLLYLKISMCDGVEVEGLRVLLEGCRRLAEVNFSWSHFTSDHAKLVCEMLPPTVKRLNLSGIVQKDALTDDGVMKLVRSCPLLTELDLSDAPSITDISIRAILVKLPHIRDLSLSRCYGIDPMAFMLAKGIRSLNVFGCVTEEGVGILRSHLKPTSVNENPFTTVAQPTCGIHRTSIWGMRTRDHY